MTKRIFITGIAGFIGFHVARALKKRGDEVVGCDNFNTYYDPLLKKERARILQEEGIEVRVQDITEPFSLEGFSHCLHLAAQAGVRYSLEAPHKYIDANICGFLNVLEATRNSPTLKLIYASSSSVYGLNTKVPFAESDPVEKPASLYAATKRSNELMAHSYHHLYGIAVTGLRFFTVYGPFGRPDMAYFSFAKAIAEDQPINIFNQGEVQRDFTYIDDIVAGCLAAIDLGASCEIFNLGGNSPEGVLSLVEIIEEFFGKKAKKLFLPMQPGDVYTTFADLSKSSQLLNFSPKTTLKEGMQKFLEWYCHFEAIGAT